MRRQGVMLGRAARKARARREAARKPRAPKVERAVTFGEMLRSELALPDDAEVEFVIEVEEPEQTTVFDLSEIGGVEGLRRMVAEIIAKKLVKLGLKRGR